jgi:PIN domain nuclease of toxin-antitoxin system
MIAGLRGETGADVVEDVLFDDEEPCAAHAINLCEVYYKFMRTADQEVAVSAIEDLKATGLNVSETLDEEFWWVVGVYKTTRTSLPLADCFVVTLANVIDAEVVTADHPDFDSLAEEGICRVRFIR